ncbi:MAG: acetylornithine deacetylase [Gammaproteobacteria bacterium]|nr:acetylornithine deacetylase [Gammaproteobacteria bacterium]
MPTQQATLIENIRDLIRIPSISSFSSALDMPNRPMIDHLATQFAARGFEIDIQEVPGKPGKANLIATLGRGDTGLVLAGHTDTVPFDDGKWATDPFSLTDKDDRLYGLGTSDMKSFFAVAMAAVDDIRESDLKSPLIILATADEETSMSGAKALAAGGELKARYAVIGEPTELQPVRMHKGIFMERIRIEGRSGHSGDPEQGNSALEGMHRVIRELLKWRTELQQYKQDPAFSVPVTTLNLGRIQGGDNPNRICRACELDIDLRMLPGMHVTDLRGELRARLHECLSGADLALEFEALFDGVDPLETPQDDELIKVAESLTGAEAKGVVFGTEGPFLRKMGMQVVILGPGSINQAHQPNEYLALANIQPAVEILQAMIHRFCVKAT